MDEGSDQSAAWLEFNMFNKDHKREHYKIPKTTNVKNQNSPIWCIDTKTEDKKQPPTKTQHKTGYLNMVPNQRQ